MPGSGIKIRGENKYLHLLIWLVINFLASPFIEKVSPHFPIISLVFLLSLILTLRALKIKKRLFIFCTLLGITAFVFELLPGTALTAISLSIFIIFILTSIVLMAKHMFEATRVTGDTVLGGICVYFLIGYLFALLYYMVLLFDHNAFFFSSRWDNLNLFYLSFTTITTLGYGDVYPVNTVAMVFANLEAIAGQLYLAVFVARMVGMHVIHHQSRASS